MNKRSCKKQLKELDELEKKYYEEYHKIYSYVSNELQKNKELSDEDIMYFANKIAKKETTYRLGNSPYSIESRRNQLRWLMNISWFRYYILEPLSRLYGE